ncbi:MAG: BON domain-containing protein [Gammaproteobacteria bacterium]
MSYRTLFQAAALSALLGLSAVACTSTPTQESTGQYIDSSVITSKVKTKLFEDSVTTGFDISVKTYKGVVQLSGFVDNASQKRRAEALARSVAGVRDVKNDLVIKPD